MSDFDLFNNFEIDNTISMHIKAVLVVFINLIQHETYNLFQCVVINRVLLNWWYNASLTLIAQSIQISHVKMDKEIYVGDTKKYIYQTWG